MMMGLASGSTASMRLYTCTMTENVWFKYLEYSCGDEVTPYASTEAIGGVKRLQDVAKLPRYPPSSVPRACYCLAPVWVRTVAARSKSEWRLWNAWSSWETTVWSFS